MDFNTDAILLAREKAYECPNDQASLTEAIDWCRNSMNGVYDDHIVNHYKWTMKFLEERLMRLWQDDIQ